jgi:hypothetical protein
LEGEHFSQFDFAFKVKSVVFCQLRASKLPNFDVLPPRTQDSVGVPDLKA